MRKWMRALALFRMHAFVSMKIVNVPPLKPNNALSAKIKKRLIVRPLKPVNVKKMSAAVRKTSYVAVLIKAYVAVWVNLNQFQ
jgi:hypothetical protein